MNTILHQRQLEEYYCTLVLRGVRSEAAHSHDGQLGTAVPGALSPKASAQIELPGVPLGSFQGTTYDEVTLALHPGDVFVFYSDGVSEAMNDAGGEFTSERIIEVVNSSVQLPAAKIVEALVGAVEEWRAGAPPNDDMTAVALKITA